MPVREQVDPNFPDDLSGLSVKAEHGRVSCSDHGLWDHCFPVTPEEAYDILSRDLKGRPSVTMLGKNGPSRVKLLINGDVFHDQRTLYLLQKKTSNGDFHVEGRARHTGIGRIVMRNQIEFYHAAGLRQMNIIAGSTAGGYVWARFGFLPEDQEADDFRVALNRKIEKNYLAIAHILKQEERLVVESILPLRRGKDIWRLADLRIDMSSRLRDIFYESSRQPDFSSLGAVEHLALRFSARAQSGEGIPVAAVLLSQASWNGVLDFSNMAQMERAGRYVGGWSFKV
jgi:hypothetical protein